MPTVIDGITGINRITGGADVGGNLDFVGITAFTTNGIERMRLDTSGNLLHNATSLPSAVGSADALFSGKGNIAAGNFGGGGTASILAFGGNDSVNAPFIRFRQDATTSRIEASASGSAAPTPMTFFTNGAERLRILADGTATFNSTFRSENVAVPKTGFSTSTDSIQLSPGSGSRAFVLATSGTQLVFFTAAASVGTITTTAVATAYNTSSDYRLKENIRAMVAPLERLLRLKPVLFNWKVDGSDGEGFIAHELQQEVPMAVTGEKDGKEMQGVDASKVVPLLVAAVQELTLKVLALEARLS